MRHILLLSLALAVAPPAMAQGVVQIDPGMTRAQVVERLGNPATERASGGFTYLFFINGCERTCGMNDLVTLKGDTVIDAIFRAPQRTYSGRSTSPEQNRTPKANRGPLTITPARPADSVVMRIIPVDSPPARPAPPPAPPVREPPPPAREAPRPPARELPLGDLTGKTIVPGARPDSLRSTRLPVDAPIRPDSPRPGGPPGTQPPVFRSDTVINQRTPGGPPPAQSPVYRSDTVLNPRAPGAPPPAQPQVYRSDTVLNPRTAPRPDSMRPLPPPAQPPRTPPPTQQPPAT